MPTETRLRAIDQPARDAASRALVAIEKHVAICEERGRQEDAFQKRVETFLARLELSCEAQFDRMRGAIDTLGDRLRAELRAHQEDDARTLRVIESERVQATLGLAERIGAATQPIYNRFWTLAIALIGGLFVLCGFLAGRLLGWV